MSHILSCASSSPTFSDILRRQKYQPAGSHAAVKKCRWLHKSLVEGRTCYKQQFYGIESHRCLQMTPLLTCNLQCKFCWRTHPTDLGIPPGIYNPRKLDAPHEIVERSILAQRKILSGYNSQVIKGIIDNEKYQEALHPRHAAISLDGEPTLYPYIGDLISGFKTQGFTTFLVTNATQPHVLKGLSTEPTQLYLSLYAPEQETFFDICKPVQKNLWSKIHESLGSLSMFTCPTVIRLTLVKGLNMISPEKYGKIIAYAEPTYVEVKAYIYVGYSRRRLDFDHMPFYGDIVQFAEQLSRETGYNILDSSKASKVVLLSRLDKPKKLGKIS